MAEPCSFEHRNVYVNFWMYVLVYFILLQSGSKQDIKIKTASKVIVHYNGICNFYGRNTTWRIKYLYEYSKDIPNVSIRTCLGLKKKKKKKACCFPNEKCPNGFSFEEG